MIENKPADPCEPDDYLEAAVQRLLTEEADLAEQGMTLTRRNNTLILSGEVESDQRRDEMVRRLRDAFPDVHLVLDVGLTRVQEPTQAEELP
ncbi:MAG TPA: hypothetical protein VFX61_02570 [Micromonosporaceae bacterium]|nr:hypothetical protein [Micromonosporaceae bacterium]